MAVNLFTGPIFGIYIYTWHTWPCFTCCLRRAVRVRAHISFSCESKTTTTTENSLWCALKTLEYYAHKIIVSIWNMRFIICQMQHRPLKIWKQWMNVQTECCCNSNNNINKHTKKNERARENKLRQKWNIDRIILHHRSILNCKLEPKKFVLRLHFNASIVYYICSHSFRMVMWLWVCASMRECVCVCVFFCHCCFIQLYFFGCGNPFFMSVRASVRVWVCVRQQ